MKTERRHELETNALASKLAQGAEAVKPYGRGILAAILAVVVLLMAWGYIATQNRAEETTAWNDYFAAVNMRDERLLQDISEQYAGSMVADWSRLTRANWQLQAGTNRLLTDRTVARDELREASETFAALQRSSNDAIRQRATYGLARTQETLGELDEARQTYLELAETWPESPFAETSAQRAKDLEQQGTKEFYDWLATYEPPKPLSGEPGTPGARPDFLKEPDAGTLNVPSSLGDSAQPFPNLGMDTEADNDEADAAPLLPSATSPPEADTMPPEDNPAESEPAAEPAEDRPAEDASPPSDEPE